MPFLRDSTSGSSIFGSSGGSSTLSPLRKAASAIFGSSGGSGFSSFRSGTSGSGGTSTLPAFEPTFRQFESIFPRPEAVKPPVIAPPPRVTAPRMTPAVVATPENLGQRVSTIFAPQFEALAQREEETLQAVNADLAARGLAESGVGVGQTAKVRAEFDRNRTALLGEEAAQLLNVEAAVLFQNAANQQQTRLAQAELDSRASIVNAENVLRANTANAQAYLAALGLNAEQAAQYRNSFLSFFDSQQLRAIQQDELRLRAMTAAFDAFLKNKALDTDIARINAEAGGTAAQSPGSFNLPSAFAVGSPGTLVGGSVPNVTPSQFRLASGVETAARPGGGGNVTVGDPRAASELGFNLTGISPEAQARMAAGPIFRGQGTVSAKEAAKRSLLGRRPSFASIVGGGTTT